MNEQKSLIYRIVEAYEAHRLDRRRARQEQAGPSQNRGRIRHFFRWLVPNGGTILVALILILTQQVWARPGPDTINAPGPSANTVNYQGRLADPAGNPLSGTYGMDFALYDAASGGNLVWGPESHSAVPVSEGLFSVGLGSLNPIPTSTWDGDRYLEIAVGGETLSPRELIRSVPVAGMALTVPDGAITTEKVADGAITTEKVADSAVTQMVRVEASEQEFNNTTEWADLPGTEATISTEGGPVLIHFHTLYRRSQADGAGIVLRLNIDGTDIPEAQSVGRAMLPNSVESLDMMYATDLAAGTHVIKVRWRQSSNNPGGELQTYGQRQIVIVEFKK